MRTFSKELLQPALLLRELIVDLVYVHGLQQGVAGGRGGVADMDKQVFVVLQGKHHWFEKDLQ